MFASHVQWTIKAVHVRVEMAIDETDVTVTQDQVIASSAICLRFLLLCLPKIAIVAEQEQEKSPKREKNERPFAMVND